MSKRIKLPTSATGYGYVGAWGHGRMGWWLPNHLSVESTPDNPATANPSLVENDPTGEDTYLCCITVEPLTDERGQPITRIVRKEDGK